ncbi:MAG: hypothetical protein IT243_09060 [Bacteroidia bacterium]|nr:hypothetical protein [Bacteroidia bacterium]
MYRNLFFKIICLVAILTISSNAFSIEQRYIDSIEVVYKTTKNKKERLSCLYILTFEYGLFNPRKGIELGYKLLREAKKEKDSSFIFNAYNGIANCYESLMKYDSALYFNSLSYTLAENTQNKSFLYPSLSNIALCHKKLGNYNLAILYFKKTDNYIKNPTEHNPRYFYYLCELYLRINNIEKAKEAVLEGIEVCNNRKDDILYFKSILYSYLGECYSIQSKFDSAFYFLNKSINGLKNGTDKIALATTYNFLADAQLKSGNIDLAILNYNYILQIYKTLNNKVLENFTLIKLIYAKTYSKLYKKEVLLSHLSENLQNKVNYNSNYDLLIDMYSFIAKSYENLNDNKNALLYFHKRDSLTQVILYNESRLLFLDFEKSYETNRKERRIQQLNNDNLNYKLEIKNKNSTIIFIAFAFAFIIILSVIFILFLNIYNKKKRALIHASHELNLQELRKAERARISKDLHDDIGSGINKIYFLGEIISKNENTDKESLNLSEKIKIISKNLISNMRDIIWILNEEHLQTDTLIARIREYSYDYLEEKNITLNFNSNIDKNEEIKSVETIRTIIAIVKEVLSNILKHSNATKVTMEFYKTDNKLTVMITDNGVGFEENIKYGNGIKNIKTRAKEVNAEITIESKINLGTRTTLIISI